MIYSRIVSGLGGVRVLIAVRRVWGVGVGVGWGGWEGRLLAKMGGRILEGIIG
jgi:hypothetical protein